MSFRPFQPFGGVVSENYRQLILSASPELYYRLGETAPVGTGSVIDETGRHHGTPGGGITWGESGAIVDSDKAAKFSGANEGIVIPDTYILPALIPFTVEFWNFGVPAESSAFSIENLGNSRVQAHVPWSDGTLYWDAASNGGGFARLTANYSLFNGAWAHVVLVAGTAGRGQEIWINGLLKSSAGAPDQHPQRVGGNVGRFDGYPHQGSIDEFAIYHRALSPGEILSHYQKGLGI